MSLIYIIMTIMNCFIKWTKNIWIIYISIINLISRIIWYWTLISFIIIWSWILITITIKITNLISIWLNVLSSCLLLSKRLFFWIIIWIVCSSKRRLFSYTEWVVLSIHPRVATWLSREWFIWINFLIWIISLIWIQPLIWI